MKMTDKKTTQALFGFILVETFLWSLLAQDLYALGGETMLRPRPARFSDARFVPIQNDLGKTSHATARDGGLRKGPDLFFQTLFQDTETLARHLKSGQIDFDPLLAALEGMKKDIEGYQQTKGEEAGLGETSRLIQSILAYLYHYKSVTYDMKSALIYTQARVDAELLPEIRRAATKKLSEVVSEDLVDIEEYDDRKLEDLELWQSLKEKGELRDSFVIVPLQAGKGTRFKVGPSSPSKVIYPVGERPLSWYTVYTARKLRAEGFHTFTVGVIGAYPTEDGRSDQVIDAVGKDYVDRYVYALGQRGTGYGAAQAERAIPGDYDGDVIIVPGDVVVTEAIFEKLMREHRKSGAALTILTTELKDPTGKGRIVRRKDGTVVQVIEQDVIDKRMKESRALEIRDAKGEREQRLTGDELDQIKEVNLFIFAAKAKPFFEALHEATNGERVGEWFITDVIPLLQERGLGVRAVSVPDSRRLRGANNVREFMDIVSEFFEALLPRKEVYRVKEALLAKFLPDSKGNDVNEEPPLAAFNHALVLTSRALNVPLTQNVLHQPFRHEHDPILERKIVKALRGALRKSETLGTYLDTSTRDVNQVLSETLKESLPSPQAEKAIQILTQISRSPLDLTHNLGALLMIARSADPESPLRTADPKNLSLETLVLSMTHYARSQKVVADISGTRTKRLGAFISKLNLARSSSVTRAVNPALTGCPLCAENLYQSLETSEGISENIAEPYFLWGRYRIQVNVKPISEDHLSIILEDHISQNEYLEKTNFLDDMLELSEELEGHRILFNFPGSIPGHAHLQAVKDRLPLEDWPIDRKSVV